MLIARMLSGHGWQTWREGAPWLVEVMRKVDLSTITLQSLRNPQRRNVSPWNETAKLIGIRPDRALPNCPLVR